MKTIFSNNTFDLDQYEDMIIILFTLGSSQTQVAIDSFGRSTMDDRYIEEDDIKIIQRSKSGKVTFVIIAPEGVSYKIETDDVGFKFEHIAEGKIVEDSIHKWEFDTVLEEEFNNDNCECCNRLPGNCVFRARLNRYEYMWRKFNIHLYDDARFMYCEDCCSYPTLCWCFSDKNFDYYD